MHLSFAIVAALSINLSNNYNGYFWTCFKGPHFADDNKSIKIVRSLGEITSKYFQIWNHVKYETYF